MQTPPPPQICVFIIEDLSEEIKCCYVPLENFSSWTLSGLTGEDFAPRVLFLASVLGDSSFGDRLDGLSSRSFDFKLTAKLWEDSGNSEQVVLSVCGRYVVGKGGRYVVGRWWACGRYVVGMWSVKDNWMAPGVTAISTEIFKYVRIHQTSRADLCDLKRCSCVVFP